LAISSPTQMWLGSAILASLLLASSLTVSASSSTATASATTITRASVKPVLTASIVPQIYTEAVRKQMQSVPTSTDSVAVAVAVQTKKPTEQAAVQSVKQVAVQPAKKAAAQPAKKAVVQAVKSANVQLVKNNTKPVQVAASPKKQVSRSNSSDLVNNALSLIGDPYSYGGTSPSGFDCSGYTQYVFKGSGSSLPRTTAGQFGAGSAVSKDQLQSGDLVFFTTYAAGASHVGIYIGGGKFVHASNSGVRSSSLSESYYASQYLGGRRVR